MTEKNREISLQKLAGKFAGGNIGLRREWMEQLRDAVNAGVLEARVVQTPAPGLAKRVGNPIASREWASEFSRPEQPRQPINIVSRYFTPAAVAAWLRRVGIEPPALVLAWLGEAWQATVKAATPKAAGNAKADAASRPKERQTYMQAVWLELDKPKNQAVWNAIKKRAGQSNCPIIAVVGNDEFTYQYDDGGTEPLTKKTFQNDMTEVRRP